MSVTAVLCERVKVRVCVRATRYRRQQMKLGKRVVHSPQTCKFSAAFSRPAPLLLLFGGRNFIALAQANRKEAAYETVTMPSVAKNSLLQGVEES